MCFLSQAAILRTLNLLIGKGALLLKPFVPQLQTTFVKALSDTTKRVRMHGATALISLSSLSQRVEPLVNELYAGLSGDSGVQYAMLVALAGMPTSTCVANFQICPSVLPSMFTSLLPHPRSLSAHVTLLRPADFLTLMSYVCVHVLLLPSIHSSPNDSLSSDLFSVGAML